MQVMLCSSHNILPYFVIPHGWNVMICDVDKGMFFSRWLNRVLDWKYM